MPIRLRHASHGRLRALFPHSPRPNHRYQAPVQSQDDRYYFRRPLHCHDPLCHITFPPCFGIDPGTIERFMAEQWELAAGSTPSISSQHQISRVVLTARERKYGWIGLIAWFFGLILGVSSIAEKRLPKKPRKPLGEVLWELTCQVSDCFTDIAGCAVGQVVTGIRKVDWDRTWKLAAFVYIAYIWGRREEETFRAKAPTRARAVSELSQPDYEGVRYTLVEDVQGWSRSVWELLNI